MKKVACPRCNGTGVMTLKPIPGITNSKARDARCNLCFGSGKVSRKTYDQYLHPEGPLSTAEWVCGCGCGGFHDE